MATAKLSELVGHLGRRLPDAPDPATDAELLGRFVAVRDEAAFAALVRRHGGLVFGVCRRVAGDHHLAEDAFQAVFVVLAAKAGSVRPRSALPAWLYGVAYRTALRARTMSDRRRRREALTGRPPEPACETDATENGDLAAAVDAEVARLPDHLRLPVVLCELEGCPRKDAAERLGIPEGTLSSRLAAARKLLAGRLKARGVALSAAGLSAVFARPAEAAPAELLARALAAVATPGLVPASVSALSNGVIRAMFAQKLLKLVPVVALAAGAVALAATQLPAADPPKADPPKPVAVLPEQPKAAPKADPKPLPQGPNKIVVWRKGELVMTDPDGKNEKTLVRQEDGLHPHMFTLSPDGKKLAMVSPPPDAKPGDEVPPAHLYVRDVGKDGATTDLGPAGTAHWSGDGTELAVCRFTDAPKPKDVTAEHEIVNLATQRKTKVNLPADHISVDWSRDGRFFLTLKLGTSRDNPVAGIFVMNRDGSEARRITDGNTPVMFARFSPDGTQVLFLEAVPKEETPAERKAREDRGGRRPVSLNRLAVAEAATGKTARVADVPLNAEIQGFCWSPDGKRIAYVWREVHEGNPRDNQERETVSSLTVCDADGKNQKTILTETGKGPGHLVLGGVDWR